jgi:hypothetical protein
VNSVKATARPSGCSSTPHEPGGLVKLHATAAGLTAVGQSPDELGAQLLNKRVCELNATMQRYPRRRLPVRLTGVFDQLKEAHQHGAWIAGSKLAQETTLALEVLILRAHLRTPSPPSTQPAPSLAPHRCGARTRPRPRGRRCRRRRSSSSSRRSSGDGAGSSDGEPDLAGSHSRQSAEHAPGIQGGAS